MGLCELGDEYSFPVIGRRYVEHAKDYQIPRRDGSPKISILSYWLHHALDM
jgi:hypothetical protein